MNLIYGLHERPAMPRTRPGFLTPLTTLLKEPAITHDSLQGLAAHRRLLLFAIITGVALLINQYLAINGSLRSLVDTLASLSGESRTLLWRDVQRTGFAGLLEQARWAGWLLLGYVVIPVLVIRFVLREPLKEYGLGWGDTGRHFRYYLLFGGVMAGMALIASFSDTFLNTYPFYPLAGRSWLDLLLWEMLYVLQFFCIEFFYRGVLLRGLKPVMGIYAIHVSSLVYLTIHLPKPFMECFGSLLFGLILCLLAWRCRSIWGGVLVHVCLAVSMDMLSLLQRGALPVTLLP